LDQHTVYLGHPGARQSCPTHLIGPGDVVECEGSTPCPLRSACRLRGALRRAEEAFYASLDPITVAELVTSPTGPLLIGISSGRPAAD
ncbi:hypothetical protein AB0P40_31890, partial [Streptomyces sp. NPDC079189]